MTSLADQFLDDVESSENEDEKLHEDDGTEGDVNHAEDIHDDSMQLNDLREDEGKTVLEHKLPSILQRIDQLHDSVPADANESREYELVVQCTETIAAIDEEILVLHRHLKEAYEPRFPELETLIFNPLDYARVAKLAVTEDDLTKVDLRRILPTASVITVQVTAASSTGRKLNDAELERVLHLCNSLLSLDESRTKLLQHVESRAGYMAPNLVEIVGGAVAAKLMGFAGGLRQLAQMPSCNVKVMGKAKKSLQGTSSATTRQHEGVIFTCPLVTNLPKQYRSKAGDVVTGKASLAARVDSCREQRDGSIGKKLRLQLDEKFQKWQEPPPAKTAKPLPIPGDEAKRKHRGGKRARREKERLGLTDVRRLANRVKFGEAEKIHGNDLENEGLGMVGAEGSQRLRIQSKKTDTTSLAAKRRLAKQKKRDGISDAEALGITGATNLASVEGIQLGTIMPAPGGVGLGSINEKEHRKNSTYFSSSTPFLGISNASKKISKTEHQRVQSDKG